MRRWHRGVTALSINSKLESEKTLFSNSDERNGPRHTRNYSIRQKEAFVDDVLEFNASALQKRRDLEGTLFPSNLLVMSES